MKHHTVLNQHGKPYEAGDEVWILREGEHYKKYGEVHAVRNYENNPRISVIFRNGDVFGFNADEIKYV